MKFKVWDKEKKHFLNTENYNAVLGPDGFMYNAHPQGLFMNGMWVPVFSTEETDKDNAELFSGDLVKPYFSKDKRVELDDSYIGEILFKDGRFLVSGIGVFKGVSFRILETWVEWKKIGSKYENPELLENGTDIETETPNPNNGAP